MNYWKSFCFANQLSLCKRRLYSISTVYKYKYIKLRYFLNIFKRTVCTIWGHQHNYRETFILKRLLRLVLVNFLSSGQLRYNLFSSEPRQLLLESDQATTSDLILTHHPWPRHLRFCHLHPLNFRKFASTLARLSGWAERWTPGGKVVLVGVGPRWEPFLSL